MALQLPRLPPNVALTNQSGRPTTIFTSWWQSVVQQIEAAIAGIQSALAAAGIAQTAATDAASSADSASADATMAVASANAAQVTANSAIATANSKLDPATAAATYAPLISPILTGAPAAPTPLLTDNSSEIATTAFVQQRARIINPQNGNYTLVLKDAGAIIYGKNTGVQTITIPADAAVAYPAGTEIELVNRGSSTMSVAITTDTLQLAGSTSVGARTIAVGGLARLTKMEAALWMIDGAGIT